MFRIALALALAGCGRLGFDGLGETEATGGDAIGGPDAIITVPQSSTGCLQPTGLVSSKLMGVGQTIAFAGTHAYLGVAEGANGMQIVDVSDPASPALAGSFRTDSGAGMISPFNNDVLGITVAGTRAYLATYLGGVVAVDVSDPALPGFLGALDLPSETWSIAVGGNRAYATNYQLGLVVVDITNPGTMTIITSLPLAGTPHNVRVAGTRAYVAAGSAFHVVDLADPDNPALISTFPAAAGANLYGVWERDGGYVYVVDKAGRTLLTLDVTTVPPTQVNTTTPDPMLEHRAIAGDGTTIVVATERAGAGTVRLFDASTPSTPALIGDYAGTSGSVYAVAIAGDLVVGSILETGSVQVWRRLAAGACP